MKLKSLIERIRLSESDYLNMKTKSQMYDKMMSTIECNLKREYEEARDIEGRVVCRFPKSKTMIVNIDVKRMLAAGGITFDENVVTFNIT